MNDNEAPYASLSPDLILDAVADAGYEPDGRMLAMGSYENRVYQVGIEDATPIIVKFYRPARWSDAAIDEEHQFALELFAAELPVVAPLVIDGRSLLEFEGFRDVDGRLSTVIGLFRQAGIATAPIVGYDTRQPIKVGLYRLATACAYRRCMERGWRLNFSAGAAGFKRLRGGQSAIEYSMVLARHLPRRTRAALRVLSTVTCRIGAPLLRRFEL